MTEKDYSPLSASCVRALNDKLYEKRKVAALEIEKMVKEFMGANNTAQIKKLLRVLGQEFTLSQSQNSRKGGLIGLAATAIALGKDAPNYVTELVKPVLTCFFDSDSRVRYYACESLYNIVKVARGSVLTYFNDIFDGLSKLSADPDQNVRSGSELLDRLMKDIVTESTNFDLMAFMPLLQERILTRNPFARQFIVSWVTTLDAVPDIEMLVFLPEFLDGLFLILGDPNQEIRQMCEVCLGEFLQNISKRPRKVNYTAMANILVVHSQSQDTLIQFTAITWIKEFIIQSGSLMLAFTSGILTATMPCLAYDDESRQNIKEAAKLVNAALIQLVKPEDGVSSLVSSLSTGSASLATKSETTLTSDETQVQLDGQLDIPSVISVLTRQLLHDSLQTRITALRWLYHLFVNLPSKMFCHVEELFPLLLKTLSDSSDEVVLVDLEVLAEISSSRVALKFPLSQKIDETVRLSAEVQQRLKLSTNGRLNSYFTHFMISLLKLFSTDRQLLDDRGTVIIRQLCLLLNAEDIYSCCSEILINEEDVGFASHMIQTLSTILLTSSELFELRTQLKELNTEASCDLFCCLYKSWCHNPVSTVALCFLTQNYEHACQLLTIFGSIEVTVEFLSEIDKLVQLIESPIFTYLRLQLLDAERHRHLVKSLYGLLMLLPQSDAFRTLQHRLQCIPYSAQFGAVSIDTKSSTTSYQTASDSSFRSKINFAELLNYFCLVQDRHRAQRRKPKLAASSTSIIHQSAR